MREIGIRHTHVELMLLVAITAITRKVVILGANAIDPSITFGTGFVLIALSVGYYLVRRSSAEQKSTETT